MWWYGLACLLSIVLGVVACEVYPVQLRWYGVLFAMLVSFVFYIPVRLLLDLRSRFTHTLGSWRGFMQLPT